MYKINAKFQIFFPLISWVLYMDLLIFWDKVNFYLYFVYFLVIKTLYL